MQRGRKPFARQAANRLFGLDCRLIQGAVFLLFFFGAAAGAAVARQLPSAPESQESSETLDLEHRADIYMARKYYQEAIDVYRRLTDQQPSNALVYNKMGIAYHQMMDLNAAKKAYRKAIDLDPNYAQAINNLAAVEHAQKNYRAAIFTYLKALAVLPGDAVIYSNLGTAYFAYDRFEYAVSSYRYALMLDPQIFQKGGRTGNIVQQREEKNMAAFNFYLAKSFASLGNADETLQYLRKAWEEGFKDLLEALQDEVFDFLAEEPRFLELVSLIQAEQQAQN